jgi:hypothetical protein
MSHRRLKTGDLVHVPSDVYRFKKEDLQLDFFSSIKVTDVPMLGLFRKYLSEKQCLITFADGEWILPIRYVYEIQKESYCA